MLQPTDPINGCVDWRIIINNKYFNNREGGNISLIGEIQALIGERVRARFKKKKKKKETSIYEFSRPSMITEMLIPDRVVWVASPD